MRPILALTLVAALGTGAVARAVEVAPLFKSKCASCHGEDGKAQTKMGQKEKIPDMTTDKWQSGIADAKIKDTITNGKPDTKMKGFAGKLAPEEIDALVLHLRTFKAAK